MTRSEVGERWRELGNALGLSQEELGAIHRKHSKNATQCNYVLEKWIEHGNASWGVLIDALSTVNPETANRVQQSLSTKLLTEYSKV